MVQSRLFSILGTTANVGLNAGLPAYGYVSTKKQIKESSEDTKNSVEAMDEQTRKMNERTAAIAKSFSIMKKEKVFFLPALGTGLMLAQGHMQGKASEEQSEEMQEATDRQTAAINRQNRILERLSEKNAATPDRVAGLVQKQSSMVRSVMSQRNFASAAGIKSMASDVLKAAKDAGWGKGTKNVAKFAGTMALAGYGVNKYIQHDMKKSGLDVDNDGNLVQANQKSYSTGESVMASATENGTKSTGKKILGKLGNGAGALVFEAPRALSYHAEKKQLKDQIAATQSGQRQYSSIMEKNFGQMRPFSKEGWRQLFKDPGGAISGFGVQMGSVGVADGRESVQKFAGSLSKSSNKRLASMGKWMTNHKTGANLAVLAPLAAVGSVAWGGAEKLSKGILKKADPNAYKYQDAKEAQAQAQEQQ